MKKDLINAIWSIGEFLLEIILPSRDRVLRTKSRSPENFELVPETHKLYGIEITTLMNYRSGAAQDTIRALKYDGSRHAAKLCAAVLADYLREEIANIRSFSPRPILLAPVPLHPNRESERGFNQIAKILDELPSEFKDGTVSHIATSALARTRETKQQTRLSKAERLRNVTGAFKASPECKGSHTIVIDDVATTGATLAACAHALQEGGSRMTAIALARA